MLFIDRWTLSPPVHLLIGFGIGQTLVLLLYVALIYFVSSGRYWARLIYAVLLGVETVQVIAQAPAQWQYWQYSNGLLLVTAAISFTCQYIAMYWLFTEPGRRWLMR
jgi:hypothetical protein